MVKKNCTYVHLALVHVLGLASAVLGLLAKDQEQLEEEDVPLSALAEDLLGVPDLERILQDHLPVGREVVLERAEMDTVRMIILLFHMLTSANQNRQIGEVGHQLGFVKFWVDREDLSH